MIEQYLLNKNESATVYVTRVRVRVSDTIRIGYADTHFLKRKSTKMVYPRIRRVSDTDTLPPLEYPCNIGYSSEIQKIFGTKQGLSLVKLEI